VFVVCVCDGLIILLEFLGGIFMVLNFGMYGIFNFYVVINMF